MRRTPRKTAGTSPARLGINDGWGEIPAAQYVSMDKAVREKAEAEKIAMREKKVAKQNKEDDAKRSTFTFAKFSKAYKGVMTKHPKLTSSVQGVCFTGVGEAAATMIKGGTLAPKQIAPFFIWGFLVALILQPYLALFVNNGP